MTVLQKGYEVRTTVRGPARDADLRTSAASMLSAFNRAHPLRLCSIARGVSWRSSGEVLPADELLPNIQSQKLLGIAVADIPHHPTN